MKNTSKNSPGTKVKSSLISTHDTHSAPIEDKVGPNAGETINQSGEGTSESRPEVGLTPKEETSETSSKDYYVISTTSDNEEEVLNEDGLSRLRENSSDNTKQQNTEIQNSESDSVVKKEPLDNDDMCTSDNETQGTSPGTKEITKTDVSSNKTSSIEPVQLSIVDTLPDTPIEETVAIDVGVHEEVDVDSQMEHLNVNVKTQLDVSAEQLSPEFVDADEFKDAKESIDDEETVEQIESITEDVKQTDTEVPPSSSEIVSEDIHIEQSSIEVHSSNEKVTEDIEQSSTEVHSSNENVTEDIELSKSEEQSISEKVNEDIEQSNAEVQQSSNESVPCSDSIDNENTSGPETEKSSQNDNTSVDN